jgi:DNA primase
VWLYKAGLSNWEIEHRGIYFNPVMDRVVIPVYSSGKLVYWQARGFDTEGRPKYINPAVDRSSIMYKTGKGKVLVLTEDILSACRVSNLTAAWSLMGVNLTDAMMLQVMETGSQVVVALDPDPPGIAGSIGVYNKLASVGVPVRNITPALPADPKLLSLEELNGYI